MVSNVHLQNDDRLKKEKTKMANFNEGDSRHDLNYPEFPYSWNNGER